VEVTFRAPWIAGETKEFWRIEVSLGFFPTGSLVHREREGMIPEDSVPTAYFTGKEA
jgi:hypothetical protein